MPYRTHSGLDDQGLLVGADSFESSQVRDVSWA